LKRLEADHDKAKAELAEKTEFLNREQSGAADDGR
jgi:hypothetical protein